MGDVLAELEATLRSNKERLTLKEERVLYACKAKAIRDFTVGACAASGVVWAATRKLGYGHRLNYSGGAAILSGMWTFNRSLNSCLDQILALHGTRMQQMLAKIILTKHNDDTKKVRLVSKHFFAEKVFDDSHLDQPLTRWRFRNHFGDIASHKWPEDSANEMPNESESQQSVSVQKFTGPDVTADPLDFIFGYAGVTEEIHHTDNSSNLSKRRARNHKRAHRRHYRTQLQEVS